jgi:hypothetical protein
MELLQIIESLKIALDLTDIGFKVKEYFLAKPSELENPVAEEIIRKLPSNATPQEIADALTPFYEQRIGLIFKAGNDNGGDLYLDKVRAEAAPGESIMVSGGDGGPLGKGGSAHISNSTFLGGKKID